MPKLRQLKRFGKQFIQLSPTIRKKVKKQLLLLADNPKHPSLRLRKMVNSEYWEARVDYHYRMVLKWEEETVIVLMFVGTHEVYRRVA